MYIIIPHTMQSSFKFVSCIRNFESNKSYSLVILKSNWIPIQDNGNNAFGSLINWKSAKVGT